VPTKKKSCDLVHQGNAGPAPDQILDAIRAEYWLPADRVPAPGQDAAPPDQAAKPKPQVKP
jgi:hypothetical protein